MQYPPAVQNAIDRARRTAKANTDLLPDFRSGLNGFKAVDLAPLILDHHAEQLAMVKALSERRMEAIEAFLKEEFAKLIEGGETMSEEDLATTAQASGYVVHMAALGGDEAGVESIAIMHRDATSGAMVFVTGMKLRVFPKAD